MKQILYGVGKSVLTDYVDPSKIVGLSKLKDIAINFSGDEEAVTGGDDPYPITYFPKDKAITITATNALFDMSMLNATQGASVTVGEIDMTEIIDHEIPAGGVLDLEHEPIADSVVINGFTEIDTDTTIASGEFYVDGVSKQIKFSEADTGEAIVGIYKRKSSANAETISVLKDTIAKPFTYVHRIPIYDDNNRIVAQGQLIIFKCRANNNFEFNLQPQTAFSPKLELKALDPKRTDKKLWDFTIDPVVV